MYRNYTDYFEIFFNGNQFNYSILVQAAIFTILFFGLYANAFAQWINNPSVNTQLVIDTRDPVNISAVSDLNGGSFMVWQDNRNGFQNEVYFSHVDVNGNISLRPDGKRISQLAGAEENPVCAKEYPGAAVVLWKDYTYSNNGDLFAQQILYDNSFGWTDNGIRLTNSNDEISQYSVSTDQSGDLYISYIAKEPEITGEYKIEIQKISSEGKPLLKSGGEVLYKSHERKSMTNIIPDENGGAFVFWIEMQNGKSIIFGQHFNADGKATWDKKPVDVSGPSHNVITYAAKKIEDQSIYVAWQTLKKEKEIYHQIVNSKGKIIWARGGRLVTTLKGNQVNPEVNKADSSIILSWTNEQGNDKDVYIQKFNRNGKPIWNKHGVPVIKLAGEQFGQQIVGDGKGGVILAWIDRRINLSYADIYAQRINEDGSRKWDSLGLAVASNHNTLKSYLTLVSDESGGAIAIFKNMRNGKNEIYGQKVFSTGTYVSEIVDFNTQLSGDSIKVEWYTTNERGSTRYDVERSEQQDNGNINWNVIGSINSAGKTNAAKYEYFDSPTVTGTLYYRVVETDVQGNEVKSNISRINFFGASSDVIVAQNIPNPFSDSTTISFYLPDPSPVTIEFFDDHVEKISEIDKSFPAGENSITFHSSGLRPGIYFYRFKANDFVDVKKMVITN
ncbi:MAG: T9SS type A sorting domain-containing protein [Bacteroidetes bacterium]|nr:T9SS type A sorting domain-containing protein [Bacteroidota bacterium]